jgi:hypothetical protein
MTVWNDMLPVCLLLPEPMVVSDSVTWKSVVRRPAWILNLSVWKLSQEGETVLVTPA